MVAATAKMTSGLRIAVIDRAVLAAPYLLSSPPLSAVFVTNT
jgi:hypothetical protein